MANELFSGLIAEIFEDVQMVTAAYTAFVECNERFSRKRRFWVSNFHQKRDQFGLFHAVLSNLNSEQFSLREFIRVDVATYIFIVDSIRERLERQSGIRQPLFVEEKVFITLL